jgi:hypothetical protein
MIRTPALVLAAALVSAGCSIEKLAAELAATMVPLEDAGPKPGAPNDETSIQGRACRELAPPAGTEPRCTLRGRLCVETTDPAFDDAFLHSAEEVEERLDHLPRPVVDRLFAAGPLRFASGSGGVRSLGHERLTAGVRALVTVTAADLDVDSLVTRALEAVAIDRNPASAAHDTVTLARALARRFGLVRFSSDAPPEASVLGPTHADRSGADGAFLAWLDERISSEPGALLTSLLAKAARGAGPSHWRTAGDPWFVLQKNFEGGSEATPKLEELLLRHAIEQSSTVEGRAALAFRWDEALPAKARRLLTVRPVEPTGVTWMRFERDPRHPSSTLVVAADWEEHARFRLFAQLLDREGKLLRTHRFAVPPRTPHVETTLEALDDVASIVFGALSLGDPAAPFDPREGPWEPHAFLLTIAPMDGDGGFL